MNYQPPPNSIIRACGNLMSIKHSLVQTSKVTNQIREDVLSRPSKRSRLTSQPILDVEEEKNEDTNENVDGEINKLREQTFWDSPEAKCWFGSKENDKSINLRMTKQNKRLSNPYTTTIG